MRNRWHVYEYMKAVTLATGKPPLREEVAAAFPDLPEEEIREGMAEFEAVIQHQTMAMGK